MASPCARAGLSSAWIGFCANFGLTVLLGLAMQFHPKLFGMEPVPYALEAEAGREEAEEGTPTANKAAAVAGPGPIAEGFATDWSMGRGDAKPSRVDGDDATGHTPAEEGAEEVPPAEFVPRPLDIGPRRDAILNPYLWFCEWGGREGWVTGA